MTSNEHVISTIGGTYGARTGRRLPYQVECACGATARAKSAAGARSKLRHRKMAGDKDRPE